MNSTLMNFSFGTILALSIGFSIPNIASADQELNGSPKPIDSKYFGQHIHHLLHPRNPTPWPEVKFGTWRLWDAYVSWPSLEPVKGQWDFSKLDQYVKLAEQHHVEILLPLGLSPQWASARPNEKSSYSLGNAAEPRNIDDWRNYVFTVAARYKGKIHRFELWNEVNLPSFYSGDQKQLVSLAREAFTIIKDVDPGNVFVSPSITGDSPSAKAWLNTYFQEGGGNYADVIGYHFYVPTQAPEAIPSLVYDIKMIMGKYGLADKPLWNTETGWRIANTDGTPETTAPNSWKRLNPEEAASYVARALILGKVSGLDRFYWYAWDNGYMGFLELKNKSIKPAGQAYGQVYDWLVGKALQECSEKDGLWVCTLSNSHGRISHLAWTTGGENSWMPPRAWNANTVQSLDGQTQAITRGEKIKLTQSPMWLF